MLHVQSHNGTKSCCTTQNKGFCNGDHIHFIFTVTLSQSDKASMYSTVPACAAHSSLFSVIRKLLYTVRSSNEIKMCDHIMINEMHHLMITSAMKTNSVKDISTLQFIKHNWWVVSLLSDRQRYYSHSEFRWDNISFLARSIKCQ